jgi:hypothetical protein
VIFKYSHRKLRKSGFLKKKQHVNNTGADTSEFEKMRTILMAFLFVQ